MKDYEKLKQIWSEKELLYKEQENSKKLYYYEKLNYSNYENKCKEIATHQLYLTIKENIIKNNLCVTIHNELMKIYKDIYKKYETKNIGEKRKEEIENTFRKQIENIFNYTNEEYYNRFYLYFNCSYDKDIKVFNINIDKLKYNYSFYIVDNEIKSRYLFELPNYIENVEEEATRLLNLYNETLAKKEEMQKQLDSIRENLNNNFKKNLYTDNISNIFRHLYL